MENKYGYKVCYIKRGRKRPIPHIFTNTYGLANLEKNICELKPQYIKRIKKILKNPTWHIIASSKKDIKHKWKRCPFRL